MSLVFARRFHHSVPPCVGTGQQVSGKGDGVWRTLLPTLDAIRPSSARGVAAVRQVSACLRPRRRADLLFVMPHACVELARDPGCQARQAEQAGAAELEAAAVMPG
jgi:hypothetical protein